MAIDYNPENCVISVGVSDYDRSLAWYRDVLGFELVYELQGVRLVRAQDAVRVQHRARADRDGRAGQHHADLRRPRHRRRDRHLREQDVKVEDWHEIPEMVRLSTFYDPDGTPWMLAQTLVRRRTSSR